MDDGEWVLVRKPAEKDIWNPTSMALADTSKPLKVTFSGPAKHWTDAIPIGNGRLGAMVWGGIASETLQLNEDTLWTGIPGNYTNPDAPAALAEVRKLVDSGEYAEATKAAVKLSDHPSDVYQPLGDIKLEFDDSHIKYTEGTYRRELDLESATAAVIVTKISGSKPKSLSFTVSLDSKLHHDSQANGKNQIIMQGSCPGKRIAPKASANENPKGIQFAACLELQISEGGVVSILDDKKLKVEDSDWAVLLLVASSSFDGPFTMPSESRKDPTSESINALNKSEDDAVSTAERVKSFQTDEDPSFVELLFQYGRGAPHLNINLQMNYWPSLSCNLKECQEPLFDYISSLSINGSKTAKVNYEAGGWVAHQVSDIWAKTSPDRGEAVWALWPMGGAWLCTHLWEHFAYTMDKILGRKDDALIGKVREAQPKLLPTKIARDGSLMEWAQDFQDPDVHHRHLSHLFGLFPGHTITVEKTPDLCKAADNTLYKRGEDGPGWSTTWKIALWARLHNSEHAYRMVKHLISLVDPTHEGDFEGGLYSNLFTAHPPFQIDANFG
ncbi:Glycosyl hydrolase family 95 [Theobroma cacao]|nr:Glycosyl hydrolase family 95 [Theobroma cacao]